MKLSLCKFLLVEWFRGELCGVELCGIEMVWCRVVCCRVGLF